MGSGGQSGHADSGRDLLGLGQDARMLMGLSNHGKSGLSWRTGLGSNRGCPVPVYLSLHMPGVFYE